MYEVELKVELTAKEKDALVISFKERKFVSKGITPQHDLYVEAVESPYGGFNIKRYRNETDTYIYTQKTWELIENQPIRREEERAVSQKDFESALVQFPNAIAIKKDREWFAASYKGREISVTIDTVKFNHSPNTRYFIEAEIGVEDKNEVLKTKAFIEEFLKEILGKNEIIDSPGMFTMAFKRL